MAYRMYQAAFARAPDEQGLAFYVDALSSGRMTLKGMAEVFFNSPEFKSRYGDAITSGDFVTMLYRNVLGRAPDAGGFDFHKNNIDAGRVDFLDTLVFFSESPENVARVGAALTTIKHVSTRTTGVTTLIRGDNTLWAWGIGGSVGDGTSENRLAPIKIGTGFVAVSSGGSHSAAIKEDGSLWAWGQNWYGQLGDGTTTQRLRPVRIGTGFASVAAGTGATLALKQDGTLWGWGQLCVLGLSSVPNQLKPVLIGSDYAAVDVGPNTTVALKKDGSVWAWGALSADAPGCFVTKQKIFDSGGAAVAAGDGWVYVVMKDGTLWNYTYSTFPTVVQYLGDGFVAGQTRKELLRKVGDGFRTVNSAMSSSPPVAGGIKADGTLWMWGGNVAGMLGDGTTTARATPGQVASGVREVASNGVSTFILGEDGLLKAAGYGWLGNGRWNDAKNAQLTPTPMSAPVEDGTNDSLSSTYAKPTGGTGGGGTGGTGGGGTGGGGTVGGGDITACNSITYPGSKDDPQTYTFDALAQLKACQYKASGDAKYLTQGNATCLQLDSFLTSVDSTFQPLFCRGPSLKW